MKKYHLTLICSLILVFVMESILTNNVMAKENDNRILDIANKIEQYVDDHADTTAGMNVAVFNENDTIH